MENFWEPLINSLMAFPWRDAVDIIIVAIILYWVIKLLAKTRAIRVLIGLGIILILARLFVAVSYTHLDVYKRQWRRCPK